MKKVIQLFSFIPFVKRAFKRKYYASGIGVYIMNSIFKVIFRINASGNMLVHYGSNSNQLKKITIKNPEDNEAVYKSFASSGHCYYQAINGIQFGVGTIWAPGCQFISANHSYKNLEKSTINGPIIIGDHVWIGGNSVILPEVHIGSNCVIGAGSVVTRSFGDNLIIVGAPAKAIAKRCKNCLDKISMQEEYCANCNVK
jgi:acetyltransferase-like isoleucine patch superfamily enzyme